MKKLSQLAFILTMIMSLSLFTGVNTINAQVGDTDNDNGSCVDLQYNMRYRMRDNSVNNEVTDLQDYLISEGYMTGNTTGYFGLATQKAVKKFQATYGLINSGYAGPVTRAKIKSLSCDTVMSPVNPPMPNKPVACTMEYRSCPDGSAMYRDANCGWHTEMCKGGSENKKLPSITSVTISDSDTMTIYGSNLDLARNINLAGSSNPNIDIRTSFNGAIITSGYIKLENIRVKLEKYIVYTENGYNTTITINNDTQGTTSNTFQFYVPAMSSVLKAQLKAVSPYFLTITGFTNYNNSVYKTYSPGETIKFSIQGYDSNGQVATPAKGFHVQWHMYDYKDNTYTNNATMINGAYQADNAVFNYGTNMWDITATAPSANLPSGAMRKLEATFYCSNTSLGCYSSYENQIEKSFMFSINSAQPTITAQVTNYTDSDSNVDNSATFTYTINNYKPEYRLRVGASFVCTACGGLDNYRISLSAVGVEPRTDGWVKSYGKDDGTNYYFSGSGGSINFTRNMNDNVGVKLTLELVKLTNNNNLLEYEILDSTVITPTVKG